MAGEFEVAGGALAKMYGQKANGQSQAVMVDDNGYLKIVQSAVPVESNVHLGQVGGHSGLAAGEFTRPADVIQYADGDGVTDSTSAPTALSIAGAARVAAGSLVVTTFKLSKSSTNTVNANFRLWLYAGAPSAVPNDNAAFSPAVWADRANILGYVDFSTWLAGSDGAISFGTPVLTNAPAKLPAGTALTGILQAKAAYTPANAEIFHLLMGVFQD